MKHNTFGYGYSIYKTIIRHNTKRKQRGRRKNSWQISRHIWSL